MQIGMLVLGVITKCDASLRTSASLPDTREIPGQMEAMEGSENVGNLTAKVDNDQGRAREGRHCSARPT